VTVLICDLRGFTPLAETLEPEALTELLNSYFSEMVEAVTAHGGMVDKFMGDAVMAVFGLSDDIGDSAAAAVATALEMQTRLHGFNQRQREAGAPVLTNGVGIHCGEVVAGYIGSADRLEFTVIGPTVNLAARIENETRAPNPPILFSAAVAERAGGLAAFQKIGSFKPKGVSGEIDLYTPPSDAPIVGPRT
jgi:adenylate cyclase